MSVSAHGDMAAFLLATCDLPTWYLPCLAASFPARLAPDGPGRSNVRTFSWRRSFRGRSVGTALAPAVKPRRPRPASPSSSTAPYPQWPTATVRAVCTALGPWVQRSKPPEATSSRRATGRSKGRLARERKQRTSTCGHVKMARPSLGRLEWATENIFRFRRNPCHLFTNLKRKQRGGVTVGVHLFMRTYFQFASARADICQCQCRGPWPEDRNACVRDMYSARFKRGVGCGADAA